MTDQYVYLARVAFDGDTEYEEALGALYKARAEVKTEIARTRVLVGGGYSDRSYSYSLHGEAKRKEVRLAMLDRLIGCLEGADKMTAKAYDARLDR